MAAFFSSLRRELETYAPALFSFHGNEMPLCRSVFFAIPRAAGFILIRAQLFLIPTVISLNATAARSCIDSFSSHK